MDVDNDNEYVTRETILGLLTDAETAKVSNAETAKSLKAGEDFVDLESLELGVQKAGEGNTVSPANVIPRAAVSPETWRKVMATLDDLG